MKNVTEEPSRFDHPDKMTIHDILVNINKEDETVHLAVRQVIPQIEKLVSGIPEKMKEGGRLFYIGAGTSGRLGILDASEVPPTFGMPDNVVIGLIAGGDSAIRKAVESAEDDYNQAWKDLQAYNINTKDTLVGIAASGRTPYVIGGVRDARNHGILTACITCNPDTPLEKEVEVPIVAVVGPEFITGSTRLKAGTAQKMILNMITTSAMIRLGRVKGNKMVDMQLTNQKLVNRGTRIIMEELGLPETEARERLLKLGSVRRVLEDQARRKKEQ